jgi:RNA polymerase sigma-70 factor, ECF subfamily
MAIARWPNSSRRSGRRTRWRESTLERQRRVDAIGEGFEGLVARHGDYIYRLAIAIVGIDEAADVAQEVLVTAWRKRGQLRDPERERAWLSRIAVNSSIDRQRSAARRIKALPLAGVKESLLPSVAAPRTPGFDDPLEVAIRGLPIEQRAVIALHYAADLPLADVAQALGVPLGTAKSRLSAALERLRRDMSGKA